MYLEIHPSGLFHRFYLYYRVVAIENKAYPHIWSMVMGPCSNIYAIIEDQDEDRGRLIAAFASVWQ